MAERITRAEVEHVARLAALACSDEELDRFTQQLAAVLDHAADLSSLELADVPPMTHPVVRTSGLREDEVGEVLDRDEVLAAAPAAEDGRFRVPPVRGEEP